MRRSLLMAAAICTAVVSVAQKAPKKQNPKWRKGAAISIVGAQTGSRNLVSAPEKYSITGVASAYLFANKSWGKSNWDTAKYAARHTWNSSVDLSYGVANVQSTGIRKVDDKLEIYTRYVYHTAKRKWLGFGLSGDMRTQFSNGYDYSEAPRRRVSGFFAPAYLTFHGAAYFQPRKNLFFGAGPFARWTIVSNSPYSYTYQGGVKPNGEREQTLASRYAVDPVKTSRFEAGAMLTAGYERKLAKNVYYRGRIDWSWDFNATRIGRETNWMDVYWTNNFSMHVNKWLKVVYNYDLIYDGNLRTFGDNKNDDAVQMRSVLGIGVGIGF
ncbi:MAG: DUF3078 domain-containing protein [Chitinophagaceae bacterium]|nr:MAG: DUF3078 domain-containing protein [Chitinophagaceae bacterium]